MKLIGIVGMPGSGKTKLFNEAEYTDFEKFDDVLAHRELNEERIRKLIHDNEKPILVSDIEFCNDGVREEFQKRMGIQIEWTCFENAPWKCAVNCTYRFLSAHNSPGPKRNIMEELVKIDRLTLAYRPFGKIRGIKQMSLQKF